MKFLKNYKFGFDFPALLLVLLLLLPNIVYWCIPEFYGLRGDRPIDISALLFEGIGALLLVLFTRKEQVKFSFFTLFGTLTWLFLLLDYIAWIFYFCNFFNIAVTLFIAVCPCVSLLSFEAEKKHMLSLAPTAVYALLNIIAGFMTAL